MPSMMLSENFGDALDARVRKIFTDEVKELNQSSMIDMLFGKFKSDRAYEIVSGVGGLGDIQDFDGTISYDSYEQLYDKTVEFPEKAGGIKIERKLYDDNLFSQIFQKPLGLAQARIRTREKLAAAIFNGAFVGTDGGDGQPLCSSSHPYSPSDATTQDNAGTTALSAVSIEATRRIGLTGVYNNRGELVDVNYDLLLVPVNLEETAYEVINSKGKVETANNNANFHYGRYKMAVWRRLTDSNNWFFIDSSMSKMFLMWWDRLDDGIKMDRDTDTLVAKWYTYYREAAAFADWRWVYGHLVT